jgi:uncharacterized protein with HEPN domain
MPFDPLRGALRDIREHIELARSFVAGMSFESFSADRRTAYAVTRCLEIISEASRKLPLDLKARHPAIPWTDIAGAGNVYRHDYEEVLDQIVWLTVERSLGPLYSAILQELERLDEQ